MSTPTVKRTDGLKVPYERPVALFYNHELSMLNGVLIG